MSVLLVFSTLFCLGYSSHVDLSAYPLSSVLKADGSGTPLFTLYWNFSTVEQTITFAVRAQTNGWVGFGISPNGGMTNSDVVIGWVNDDGKPFLHDRYAFRQSRPPVDPQQDWFLTGGENNNGYTTLQFWRKWVTCDERDRDIEANTARVVYAWNDDDPENDDPESGPMYHMTNRGSASLNLLGGLVNAPPEPPANMVGSFNITVQDVMIPSSDTTYWCAAFEIPQDIQTQQRYIIRYSPIISPNEFQYVHHILAYLCDSLDQSDVGTSGPCNGPVSSSVSQCLAGELIAGWAVGGNDFVYPKDVAYPIGGVGNHRFLVMQIHYDNPQRNSGILDSSGFLFIYENAPRLNNAGILTVGHEVNRLMIVPPLATNYGVTGLCSEQCTSRYLPQEGIKIFANLLHTHLVGRGLTLRILRRTNKCGGLEELKPIDQNLQYDFNYQQFTHLPEEITVYPGDILLLDCNYNTSQNQQVVLGGESTRQEMCFAFPVYYPSTALSSCVSNPTLEAFVPFATKYIPNTDDRDAIVFAYQQGTAAFENAINQRIQWSPEAAAGLEDSIRSGKLQPACRTNQEGQQFQPTEETLPNIRCPYKAPDVCQTAGEASRTASILSVVTMTFLVVLFL